MVRQMVSKFTSFVWVNSYKPNYKIRSLEFKSSFTPLQLFRIGKYEAERHAK